MAPLVIDGAVHGELFRAYVEQHLARELRAGNIVAVDNLLSHKVAAGRAVIKAAEAWLVYLPPYNSDRNSSGSNVAARVRRGVLIRKMDAMSKPIVVALPH